MKSMIGHFNEVGVKRQDFSNDPRQVPFIRVGASLILHLDKLTYCQGFEGF